MPDFSANLFGLFYGDLQTSLFQIAHLIFLFGLSKVGDVKKKEKKTVPKNATFKTAMVTNHIEI